MKALTDTSFRIMQYVGEALGYACIALIRSFGPASLAGNSFATFWTVTAGTRANPSPLSLSLCLSLLS
jgi:hypothetical protein